MQDLTFAQPIWLYAGITLALGGLLAFRYLDRKNRNDLERFASGQFLAGIRTGISKPRRIIKRTCYLLGILLLFTALARPLAGFEWREVKRKGIDILFAIDSSRSMLAEDIPPNRLERVKLGMIDFVEKLDGDRIGLLPFSGSSFLLCPLTLDYNTFKTSLDAVDTEIIPHKGTDIASAIREADAIFEEAGNNHRILVVLTDGEDLQGEALAAAKEAFENGMIIHTVGIGSPEGDLIPIGGAYLRDASGNPVKTKLDEAGLKAISEATHGTYARFGQLGEGLQTIYQKKLALIPKEELKQRMQKVPVEQYQWPLGAAILLFLLDFIMSDRRGHSKAKDPSAGALTKAATILAAGCLAFPNSARAESAPKTYNSGITAFTDGDFDKAQQAFHDTLANTNDLGLQAQAYYNLGNTHFSIGAGKLEENPKETIADWEKSLLSYKNSLKLNPEDPDAEYNRDYVKQLLDELKKQENQQEENKDDKSEDQEDSGNQDQENKESNEKDKEDQSEEGDSEEKSGEEKQEGEQSSQEQQDGSGEEERDKENQSEKDHSEKKSEEEQQKGDQSQEEQQDMDSENEEQGQAGGEPDKEKEGEESQSSNEGEEGEESEEQLGKPGDSGGKEGEDNDAGQAAREQARKAPGEMSPEEAKQLLKALQKDEKRVILIPQKEGERRPQKNKTKGKDW